MKVGVRIVVAVFVAACGGSQQEPSNPSHKTEHTESSSAAAPAVATDTAEEAPRAPARRCTDGTCFACGAGYCPVGFYCDEGATGGAACSWLPACASKNGCGCLGRALSGCKCDDTEGGPHVRCN